MSLPGLSAAFDQRFGDLLMKNGDQIYDIYIIYIYDTIGIIMGLLWIFMEY
jgi:hypothetical protein